MIKKLSASHYKSIGEIEVDLDHVNVFVGKNGSGKSNIIDALDFLSDIVNQDLDYAMTRRHGSDSVRQWSKYKPYHISLRVDIKSPEGSGFYRIAIASSRNSYRVHEETGQWIGENIFSEAEDVANSTFTRFVDGSVAAETDSQVLNDFGDFDGLRFNPQDAIATYVTRNPYSDFSTLFSYLFKEISSFSAFAIFPNTVRAPQPISRAVELEHDGKNIASVLKQMSGENKRDRDRLVKSLRVALPILSNIAVKSAAGYYVPVVYVKGTNDEEIHELNMSQVSDGTLRVLGMLAAFNQPNAPDKIAIEEPEQMIHPGLLIILYDAIRDYIRRKSNGQVFLTTHSPTLIDMFDVSELRAVDFINGSTICGKVSRRQIKVVIDGLMTAGEVLLSEGFELESSSDR